MSLPNTYTSRNETGCCPIPNLKYWHKKEMIFDNQHFIKMYTRSIFHIPLNMGKIMKKLNETAEKSKATMPMEQGMTLSREISPWKAEQLYRVIKPIEGANNVNLNGNFMTLVFEGPYKNMGQWYQAMREYVKMKDKKIKKSYFFYTTCPKCAKHYGKNYVIGLVKVA